MKIQDSPEKDNNVQPDNGGKKPDKQKFQMPKWGYAVLIAALVVGFFMAVIPSDKKDSKDTKPSESQVETQESVVEDPSPDEVREQSKTKESEESKTDASTDKSEESTTESKAEEKPKVDMAPKIADLFKVYQEYNTKDVTPEKRAEEMKKYASDEVINQLLPGALSGKAQHQSFITDYKFTKPVEVRVDAGDDNYYSAVLNYKVTVNENSSEHMDSYMVKVDGDKIVSVVQKSAMVK